MSSAEGKRAQTGLGHQACGEGDRQTTGVKQVVRVGHLRGTHAGTGLAGGEDVSHAASWREWSRQKQRPEGGQGATGGQHNRCGVSEKAVGEVGQDRASRP